MTETEPSDDPEAAAATSAPDDADDPLEHLMAGMAEGDPAFLFAFVEAYGEKVRWVVLRIVEGMGRRDVLANRDEIDALTLDACEVVFARAAGWRPGGAKPWNWAYKAIRSDIARTIGHRVVELGTDEDLGGEVGCGDTFAVVDLAGDDLGRLIARDDRVRLLDEAIRAVGSSDAQEIYWEYRLQQGFGDPSPAQTVGARFGKRPATIRQTCKRHGDAVWALVRHDERFAALRDHGWFAA